MAIALIATVIAVTLASFTAYAIARLDFPGKSVILAGALAIAMFPPISVVGPLFDMWRALGLYDTYLGLIIPYLTFALPLAIYTLVAFFREIPWELEQAAQVDGATPWQAFRKVILPLAAPGVFTAAILVFIFAWNDFVFAITLTSSDAARTVPAALAFFTGRVAVHRADRQHRRRRDPRDDPDHHLRAHLPAPHRRRAHGGRRQGIGETRMAEIKLNDVTKRYADGTEAVKKMNLEIKDGEFMILVGPSGCGKSTALRMIAGLEDISEGELSIGDKVVNDLAPRDRDIAMVFQNYALYPHMTVRANMGFALKLAKVAEAEIDQKVEEAARILDLTEHLDRKPANLSGGQRQRVAMGRAIVRDPQAFLMDEPLSNLDAKLRVQTRTEVSRLQKRLSHDDGLRHPRPDRGDDARRPRRGHALGRAAAGRPAARALQRPGQPLRRGLHRLAGDELLLRHDQRRQAQAAVRASVPRRRRASSHSGDVIVGIRPEDFEDAGVRAAPGTTPASSSSAPIEVVESMGSEIYVYFSFEGGEVQLRRARRAGARLGRGGDAGRRRRPRGRAAEPRVRGQPRARRPSSGSTAPSCISSIPATAPNVRRGGGEQKAAAKATQAAVEAEADESPPKRAAAEQDAPPAAPDAPKGAEPDERSAPE